MKTSIDILKAIKKAEVSDDLYESILQKIEYRKNVFIQPVWIRVAAAVFVGLMATELYIITPKQTAKPENPIETIMPIPNNMLYNE